MKSPTTPDYEQHYSPEKLVDKLKNLSAKALAMVALKAFLLHELLKEGRVPLVVKVAIITTLGYVICPLDAIPDPLPGGYADDVALMVGLLASLNPLITAEINERAQEKVSGLVSSADKHSRRREKK